MKKVLFIFLILFMFSSFIFPQSSYVDITELDLRDEYLIIKNTSSDPVDMTGWYLHDMDRKHEYYFYGFVLEAGETVQMQSGDRRFKIEKLDYVDHYIVWENRNV